MISIPCEHSDNHVTPREAVIAALEKHPVWQLTNKEIRLFLPRVIPDNVARAYATESRPFDKIAEGGGRDMFGVMWKYIPTAMGSMEDMSYPPLLDDANDWPEKITFPDIDSWNWEESALENNGTFLTPDRFNQTWFFTGWFERLVSFMGMEEALVAMIDEDQIDAVAELFMALSDNYIKIVDRMIDCFDCIDGFLIHDDWGSQVAPMFDFDTAATLLVPAMRKFTDHIHSRGKFVELHSCGCSGELHTPNFIAAGFDAWAPQTMNDISALWEKYGSEILLPAPIGYEITRDTPEEEQIRIADEYVERYCTVPGKPSIVGHDEWHMLQPAFTRELHKKSCEAYAKWSLA